MQNTRTKIRKTKEVLKKYDVNTLRNLQEAARLTHDHITVIAIQELLDEA